MKYPTRNGLIVPPYELGYTIPTQEHLDTRRLTQNHHGYFTRANYQEGHEKIFRGLVTNVYPMLAYEHNTGHDTLHDRYAPPNKPKSTIMIDVVEEYLSLNGVINVVHERDTSNTYQVNQERWERIRSGL